MSIDIGMLSLLAFVKDIMYHYEGHKHVEHKIYESHSRFFALYQGKDDTYQDDL